MRQRQRQRGSGYRTELTPFGGIKASGLGVKEGVVEAIHAMTTVKLYTMP